MVRIQCGEFASEHPIVTWKKRGQSVAASPARLRGESGNQQRPSESQVREVHRPSELPKCEFGAGRAVVRFWRLNHPGELVGPTLDPERSLEREHILFHPLRTTVPNQVSPFARAAGELCPGATRPASLQRAICRKASLGKEKGKASLRTVSCAISRSRESRAIAATTGSFIACRTPARLRGSLLRLSSSTRASISPRPSTSGMIANPCSSADSAQTNEFLLPTHHPEDHDSCPFAS